MNMKFRNDTGKGIMVYVDPKTYSWKSIMPGEDKELNISEAHGRKCGLTPVVNSTSSVGHVVEKKANERQFLIDLDEIDVDIADALLRRFGSLDGIKKATRKEITSIPGIGPKRFGVIKKAL